MSTKKEQCKELMLKYFGEASAKLVEYMDEEECVDQCKRKVTALIGLKEAEEFDKIM
ncbi:hypothetical protein ACFLZ9_01095 [Patescibacteria group bacterium]